MTFLWFERKGGEMAFIYETHLHTCEASRCGRAHGRDYIEYMKDQGYSGIIVTDHFFNGNSAVPQDLPWQERVEMYVSGYKAAASEAADKDFTVLFGIEYNFDGDEYLLYGVDEEWLLGNSDIMSLNRRGVYNRVHAAGGIMVQAHPYRERDYIKKIHLTPSVCDGIEVYNAANGDNMNALAYQYAMKLGVPMSGGSDIHFFYDGPKGGMMFDHKIETIEDYIHAFMNREGTPVALDGGRAVKVRKMEKLVNPEHEATLEICMHED